MTYPDQGAVLSTHRDMGKLFVINLPPGTGTCTSTTSDFVVVAEYQLQRSGVSIVLNITDLLESCVDAPLVATISNNGLLPAHDVLVTLDPNTWRVVGGASFGGDVTFAQPVTHWNSHLLVWIREKAAPSP